MKDKRKIIYLSLFILSLLFFIFKSSIIPDEDINFWISTILKIPAIYFFCGIFSPGINIRHLFYITGIVTLLAFINSIGNPVPNDGKELIGYLIGTGILGLILFILNNLKSKDQHS